MDEFTFPDYDESIFQNSDNDFLIFVESLHQALPEFSHNLKSGNPHLLGAQRNFFNKEFEILELLASNFGEDSKERVLSQEAKSKWEHICSELRKTPLDISQLQADLSSLEHHMLLFFSNRAGDSNGPTK